MPESHAYTGGETVGWVSDPDGRGTISLLTSCLLSLGLCVWSAMHLDIPPRRISQTRLALLYLKWATLGVLGPELVVFVAWRQLNSARTLQKEVQIALAAYATDQEQAGKDPDSVARDERDWSKVHGFYGGMGGYIFDFEKGRPRDLAACMPGLRRLTLTPRGVALAARCGLLPHLTREEIEDKSKADSLAKTVVCFQATWFIVQAFGRVGQHLPVTLLEVNTLAHVVCTLLMYLLWWNKPSMIYEPTLLVGDWVPAICAYMYMSSQISIWERDRPGISRSSWLDSELSALTYVKSKAQSQQASDAPDARSENTVALHPRTRISELPASSQKVPVFSKSSEKVANPNRNDLQRWKLAIEAIQQHPAISERLVATEVTSSNNGVQMEHFHFITEELVTEYSSNWPSEHLLRGTGGLVMGMILWSASMAFGAIHLSAWHDHFPSVLEAWLWRASALWIASSGAIWLLINLLAKVFPWIDKFWDSVVALTVNRFAAALIVLLCALCGAAYIASRLFLVIEAFISIRALPRDAYNTPDWSQVIPHL